MKNIDIIKRESQSNLTRNLPFLRRKHGGQTQEEVAEKLGIAVRNYQKYESGDTKPNKANLVKLANIFELKAEELMSIDHEATENERKKQAEHFKKMGNVKKSFLMNVSTSINYELVQKEYKLTPEQLILLAPLLFTLLAEMSLKWRKEKLALLYEKLSALESDANLLGRVVYSYADIEMIDIERRAIENREVFGYSEDVSEFGPEGHNPFIEYLQTQTTGTTIKIHNDLEDCPDFVGGDAAMEGQIPSYNILPETLHKIFGENDGFKPSENGEYNYSIFSKLIEIPNLREHYEAMESAKWEYLRAVANIAENIDLGPRFRNSEGDKNGNA